MARGTFRRGAWASLVVVLGLSELLQGIWNLSSLTRD